MRQARIRPEDSDTVMHVFNRVTGPVGDYPFGPAELGCVALSIPRAEVALPPIAGAVDTQPAT